METLLNLLTGGSPSPEAVAEPPTSNATSPSQANSALSARAPPDHITTNERHGIRTTIHSSGNQTTNVITTTGSTTAPTTTGPPSPPPPQPPPSRTDLPFRYFVYEAQYFTLPQNVRATEKRVFFVYYALIK